MFSSTSHVSQGLSATEYTAIGLSSVILALIYVASVSLYLHSRRAKWKSIEEANITLDGGRDGGGLVKSNPLLAATRHFESDTNSGLTESDLGEDLPASDNEQGFENVSALYESCYFSINSLLFLRAIFRVYVHKLVLQLLRMVRNFHLPGADYRYICSIA